MYHYNPETTDVFEISLYTRYQHALTLIRYHSLSAIEFRKSGNLISAAYHESGVEIWSDMAELCECQMSCECIRELTAMIYSEFTSLSQKDEALDRARYCLLLSNSQFAAQAHTIK